MAQSYEFCSFSHTFIYNKLAIIKKGGTCFQPAAFPNPLFYWLTR
ncbi:hypothetical protein HMPREF9446_01342 [Bacteroides fluxus YIT 12057]|uniref:Uncharacterized protein n=1 Tax=Bacteroides fluxus YIT 12057 TaxID=763034 RepID=F3PRJ1_9BACE|nr:hypothetical protein HMPREF9446_01342 [Bacteroides fluxus YIT 12057]